MTSRFFLSGLLAAAMLFTSLVHNAQAQVAGESGANDLVIAGPQGAATVVVSPDAGEWERRAAEDLVKYIEMMTGKAPTLANTAESIKAAKNAKGAAIVVGQEALAWKPDLQKRLAAAAKKNPVLRSDAIVVARDGSRVYVAGNNDDSNYYAVSYLLQAWGCRWYLPTEFGECIPAHRELKVGQLDYAYGSPFEVRSYWLSWVGDNTGRPEFMHRNYMNTERVPNGHILAKYTKDLAPKGKTHWNVPITTDETAKHVADQVAAKYSAGEHVQLGMEDGLYESDDPRDKELISLQYDKYFLTQSVTDAFMVFYNKVAEQLMKQHPNSDAKIGFLAYANLTMPPVRDITARKPLVAYLAPIDIDPIHSMDDSRSAPRQEYKDMLYRWAEVMQGRVVIYDYDQGMLVWRDVPAPSHQMFRHDIKHYAKAGILGVDTESRGAMATIFTNLFFRGQLMWDLDADVDALLAEFYAKFYGPAAEPMSAYWNAIFDAWEDSLVTEHEHFVIPAVYTPELMQVLAGHLAKAQQATAPLAQKQKLSRQEQQLLDRMIFTSLGFGVLKSYTDMIAAANTHAQYAKAVKAGEQGLAMREQLTEMNGTFTTYKKIGERGSAWWPGEVETYRKLAALTDGTSGNLIEVLPLEWPFRRDPEKVGAKQKWFTGPVDLAWWKSQENSTSAASRQQNPGEWELVRADVYLQGQGLITPDFQSWTGQGWYKQEVELTSEQVKEPVHLMFPGLFNQCTLYINGDPVAERTQHAIWWRNSYDFNWDVDVSGKLKPGVNTIALQIDNPHHFGGMFRRPFLYRPVAKSEK